MFTPIGIHTVLAWALALTASAAMADCEWIETGGPVNSTLALGVNPITVGRDVAVGTEVYRQVFNPGDGRAVRCSAGTDEISVTRSVDMPSAPIPGFSSRAGGRVYPTNLAGIGVQFLDADNQPLPSASSRPGCPGPEACVLRSRDLDIFTLSFIKISANVQAGAIFSATLPTVSFGYEVRGQPLPMRKVRLSGQLRVVSHTCQTPNVQLSLGDHPASAFENQGATPWQDFGISLHQCPGFHGYYVAGTAGVEPGAVFNANTLAFRIDPTQPAVSSDDGILSLTPGARGAAKAAQGIGVQVAFENTQPIRLSTLFDSGLPLHASEGGGYFIRLKARYIKQANVEVESGPANATATFTINYQ